MPDCSQSVRFMKIALIANHHAGGNKGSKLIDPVTRLLAARDISCDLMVTTYHQHAWHIAENLAPENYDGIVCLGGDGTNYQILNGLLKSHSKEAIPPLGIIPVGRGNSFARDLNIHSTTDGVAAVAGQRAKPVDVCSFTQRNELFYFINLAGFGFVTDAGITAHRFNYLGIFSYVVGVLLRTMGLSLHHLELEIDGKLISGKNCFVEFCNSRFTGGAMLMAPEAKIDDGLLDVVVVGPLSRISLMATFPKIYTGKHGENPAVSFYQAQNVKVRTTPAKMLLPDGEIFGTTPTEINIHPKSVRYFC